MKIGIVFDDSLDRPDGVQQYILTLGKWLSEQGHDVHYLVGQSAEKSGYNIHSISKTVKIRFNGNVLRIPLPASISMIKQLLENEKFDILHVQMPYSPWLAGKIIRYAPRTTAIVGTFHILPYTHLIAFANRLLYMAQKKQLKKFDQVMSTSLPAKEFAQSVYGIDSSIVPNMVNNDFYLRNVKIANKKSTELTILFLGRLVERKGCLYLLRAVHSYLLENEVPDFRLIIAGDGPLKSKLQNYVADTAMTDKVDFLGFVPEKDKVKLMSECDIAIFPSISGESFGIVLLEAMTVTKGVVLAGNNPGYEYVMAPFPSQVFDPKNTSAFSKVIKEFATNPTKRYESSKKQKQYVKQFFINQVGPQILSVYNKALHKKESMR